MTYRRPAEAAVRDSVKVGGGLTDDRDLAAELRDLAELVTEALAPGTPGTAAPAGPASAPKATPPRPLHVHNVLQDCCIMLHGIPSRSRLLTNLAKQV